MYGIAHLPLIPMRSEPASKSEMCNQLLFGDTYKVIDEQEDWVKIHSAYDDYEGWISRGQALLLEKDEIDNLQGRQTVCSFPFLPISCQGQAMLIPAGATIYGANGSFQFGHYHYELEKDQITHSKSICETASLYLNSPYLWGGRSPFGIDCSGFTQVVFKQHRVKLKRDAWMQAGQGETISFLTEARAGDLAFFDNEDGKITHVGILKDCEHIYHASGWVKLDSLDNYGIINSDTRKYSHKLRIIKRI